LNLPAESAGEEEKLATTLGEFLRLPEGAEGMALLASRTNHTARRLYLFPGSHPRVREVVSALVRQYRGVPCDPPAADEAIFLMGSTTVWKQLSSKRRGA
jgi:hypothetical protein